MCGEEGSMNSSGVLHVREEKISKLRLLRAMLNCQETLVSQFA